MPKLVNIRGLNKRDLIIELWNNAKLATFFEVTHEPSPKLDDKELDSVLEYNGAGYLSGRPLKLTFTKNFMDVEEYDAYNGENVAESIIEEMRSELKE